MSKNTTYINFLILYMIAKYNIKFTEEQDLNKAKKRILKRQKQKHLLDPTQVFEVSMEKKQEAMTELNELNRLIGKAVNESSQIIPFADTFDRVFNEAFYPNLIQLDNTIKSFSNKLKSFIPNSIYVSLDDLNSMIQNFAENFFIPFNPKLQNYLQERNGMVRKLQKLIEDSQKKGVRVINIDLNKFKIYIEKFDSIWRTITSNIRPTLDELLKNYNERRALYRQPQGQTAIEIVGGSRGFDRIYGVNEKYMPVYI